MKMKRILCNMSIGLFCLSLISCTKTASEQPKEEEQEPALSFTARQITDSAKHWWAHVPVDVTNDGIVDLVFIHNNSSGGPLAYYEGTKDTMLWKKTIIAETPPTGGLFASGDLEAADMDGDGDIDVFAVKHPGEWTDAGAEAEIFWYENPDWTPHTIGSVPDAVKDVNFGDFDNDGLMDLAILTFDENSLSIFKQNNADDWARVQFFKDYGNLHEGMGIGDVDGDDDLDIAANGYVFYNPGSDLTAEWAVENLNERWNTQEGDWSRNGTKIFTQDIDGDGQVEIFMGHSERSGYPVVWYQKQDDGWVENVILDSLPACHTLQVFDFDLDGDYDLLAGVNMGRAVNLGYDSFPVTVYLNAGDNQTWEPMVLTTEGIYNGQVADYDGDGDYDIFRYPQHEATDYFLLVNNTK